jgi:hypothetical protein
MPAVNVHTDELLPRAAPMEYRGWSPWRIVLFGMDCTGPEPSADDC